MQIIGVGNRAVLCVAFSMTSSWHSLISQSSAMIRHVRLTWIILGYFSIFWPDAMMIRFFFFRGFHRMNIVFSIFCDGQGRLSVLHVVKFHEHILHAFVSCELNELSRQSTSFEIWLWGQRVNLIPYMLLNGIKSWEILLGYFCWEYRVY